MTLDPEKYRLSDAEHEKIFQRDILPDLFKHAKAVEKPVAVIFGGQPGAGKSAAVDHAVTELSAHSRPVQIIGDDFRAYHPKYNELLQKDDKIAAFYTKADTGLWVEKAIEHAKGARVNVVVEGTMRDADKVAQTMRSFRDAGYEVDARALAVNANLSWQGVLQRYEAQKAVRGDGRMTTRDAHDKGYSGLPITLERIENEKLADRLTLYKRGADEVYRNELRNGEWVRPPEARQALEKERARVLTPQEHKYFLQGYDRLATLIAAPERKATPDEIKNIEDLRQRAYESANPYIKGRLQSEAAHQIPKNTASFQETLTTKSESTADKKSHETTMMASSQKSSGRSR